MDVGFFWKILNKDIEQIKFENLSDIASKYVNARKNPAWCDSFIQMFGVHKSLCVFVLFDELESQTFFALLTGYYVKSSDDISNIIDDIKQTMKDISVLEKVKMD